MAMHNLHLYNWQINPKIYSKLLLLEFFYPSLFLNIIIFSPNQNLIGDYVSILFIFKKNLQVNLKKQDLLLYYLILQNHYPSTLQLFFIFSTTLSHSLLPFINLIHSYKIINKRMISHSSGLEHHSSKFHKGIMLNKKAK